MADEPTKLYAGDTVSWTHVQADYPASDGWVLTYYFALGSATPEVIAAAAAGLDYLLTIPAATSDAWVPGTCHWTARVVKAGDTHTVGQGSFEVLPNPSSPYDRRTHAEKCLAAITAVIEGRMGDPITEYEVDGVKAKKLPHTELVALRAHYKGLVRRQKGGPMFRRVPVAFYP